MWRDVGVRGRRCKFDDWRREVIGVEVLGWIGRRRFDGVSRSGLEFVVRGSQFVVDGVFLW